MAHLSSSEEIWPFKVFERHADFGITHERVFLRDGCGQFRKRQGLDLQATGGSQRYEAVGWDGDGLIVFRSKSEMDLEDITISQPVQRMAISRQGWILDLNPCAVRSTGCRTFRRLPVRNKDSQ